MNTIRKKMIIKKVRECEKCPIFYAPFYYSYEKMEMKVTLIGLNLVLYFLVEFYGSFIQFGSLIKRHKRYQQYK
jgi:hypothetical protein